DQVVYNTVHLNDQASSTTSASVMYTEAFGASNNLSVTIPDFGLTIANNIFSNNLLIGSSFGINIAYQSYYGNDQIAFSNNNILNAPGAHGALAYRGTSVIGVYRMDSVRMWTGGDGASWRSQPTFISNTDPHLNTGVAQMAANAGTPLANVTNDIDNLTRSLTQPNIGASEAVLVRPTDVMASGFDSPLRGFRDFRQV